MEVGLVAVWIGLFLGCGLLALPLSAWLFEDAQGAFAVPLGLAVLGVVAHLVGHVAFGLPAALAGLGALLGLSIAARIGSGAEIDRRGFGEASVVFVLAFLLIVLIRGFDPAVAPLPIAIGEKFLDFGLLASLGRTDVLPPEDVWFAGRAVRYYYGGHMLTSVLTSLTGVAPRFAYNLALAGFYATLVTAAYGLAGSIAAPYAVPRRLAAGLSAFFVGVAGNLETPAKVLVWLVPDAIVAGVVSLTGVSPEIAQWSPGEFYYFDASRVLPIDPTASDPGLAATEFPLFAWMNGDLHAHMLSQPFTLLVAGLLLAYWRLPAERRRKRLLVLFCVLPAVGGFVGFVNLWSFPSVGGLTVLAVALAPADPTTLLPSRVGDRLERRSEWARRALLGIGAAVAVLLLGVVWTLPFWIEVVPGGPGRTPALWDAKAPLWGLLLVHGAFLAVFFVALARRVGAAFDGPARVFGALFVSLVAGVVVGFPALGLVAPLLVGGWWLCRRTEDAGFEFVLVLAGAGLVLIVELVTLEGERFNVIFKPYAQIWLFWAVAAGVVLARLVDGWPGTLPIGRDRLQFNGRVLAAVLVVSTGLYAGFALPAHVADPGPGVESEGPTLDGLAYLSAEYPAEAPAIRWLDEQSGQPTIVTAAPGGYTWDAGSGEGSSAPATLTGLPSVLGWYHEAQYRGEEPYERRLGHVRSIYTGEGESYRGELLDYYEVAYVYVGPAERARYGSITVDEISGVRVAKQWDDVTIYRVDREW